MGDVPTSGIECRKTYRVNLGLGICHITQMPELICTLKLQMWQKSGSEHKPATVLGRAGSAGPEDLSVFTPETRAVQACTQILGLALAATPLRMLLFG